MPRYASRAYKPGHYAAYPREQPSSRRIWRYTAAAGCLTLIVLFISSSPRQSAEAPAQSANPFNLPPIERNETDVKGPIWHDDPKWLIPFSDSITDDRSRVVLPPPRQRFPIFAYYDADTEKDEKIKAAEQKLILTWRRAWWAQGFKPVILGKEEARKNSLYDRSQIRMMNPTLAAEFMRWFAWGQMGNGFLSNWLVLPMGAYDDHVLSLLRQGEYPKLTRYEAFGNGLLTGDKASVEDALTEALGSSDLLTSESLLDLLSSKTIAVAPKPDAIAFYDSSTLASQYETLSAIITDSEATGLLSLSDLINAHLHLTFRNTFSSGIAVLTPHRSQSLLFQYPAITLANALTICPPSPVPDSCPPNRLKCSHCSTSNRHPIQFSEAYTNTSSLFTIGSFPHPYTLACLLAQTKALSVSHICRNTARDPWLRSVTSKTLGTVLSGPDRIVNFKQSVASETESHRNLWLVGEADSIPKKEDLEWRFGFELPAYNHVNLPISSSKLQNKDIITVLSSVQDGSNHDPLTKEEVKSQRSFLAHSKTILGLPESGGDGYHRKTTDDELSMVNAAGAWHLADMEAWMFVRAWESREREERRAVAGK
ncbi:MAG: hypothetical protein Q9201_005478 [Fulgogasparrea decipioides]